MFRKLLTVISMAIATLLATFGVASASDYVPPAVGSGSTSAARAADVVATSKGVAGGSLSYTGAGFNVGGAVTIGAIVLLLGIGLCVAGAKFAKGRSVQH